MKKVFYSIYTKIIISILCVVSITCALTVGMKGINEWDKYKIEIYRFEDNFEDSDFLSNTMNLVSYDIYNAAVPPDLRLNAFL